MSPKTLLLLLSAALLFSCKKDKVTTSEARLLPLGDFQKFFPAAHDDAVFDCVATADNNMIVCGESNSYSADGAYHSTLFKVNSKGEIVWHKVFNFHGAYDNFFKLKMTSDKGILIIGQTTGNDNSQNIIIVKTDANGNLLFSRAYDMNFEFNFSDVNIDVTQTSDGGFAFTCERASKLLVAKLSSAGSVVWSNYYQVDAQIFPGSMIQDGSSLILAGSFYKAPGVPGPFRLGVLLNIDIATGALAWSKQYDAGTDEEFLKIEKAGTSYSVIGRLNGAIYPSIRRFNTTGDIIMSKEFFPADPYGFFNGSITPSDGGLIIEDGNGFSFNHVYLYKISSQGTIQWSKGYPQGSTTLEYLQNVVQMSDGNYMGAGRYVNTNVSNTDAIYLIKTDRNGNADCSSPNVASSIQDLTTVSSDIAPNIINIPISPILVTPQITTAKLKGETLCQCDITIGK